MHYWIDREIAPDLDELGRHIVRTFRVRERPFHFEFFRLADGRLVALEVNMRQPGGLTVDMWNWAGDIDFYRAWAEVVVHGTTHVSSEKPYYVLWSGRKAGRPVVAFPSRDGRYWDFESWGMIEACAAFIDEGRARIVAVDAIDWQSWTNQSISSADRGRRHDAYDRYLAAEVVPFVRDLTGWERAWATGASMGGYHAANVLFRHPDLFDGLIAISGLYQLGLFVGDDGSEPVYL